MNSPFQRVFRNEWASRHVILWASFVFFLAPMARSQDEFFPIGPSRTNDARLARYAEVVLSADIARQGPTNPVFTVIVRNVSTNIALPANIRTETSGGDWFYLPVRLVDRRYPVYGNLVVWRNGQKMWDLEPYHRRLLLEGLEGATLVLVLPQTGYEFRFSARERLHDVGQGNGHIETNAFVLPGRYEVQYELYVGWQTDGKMSPVARSNKIGITVAANP